MVNFKYNTIPSTLAQMGDALKSLDAYDPYKEHPYAEKWTGNIRDLVKKVRYSDARYSAIDAKSGAWIRLNLDSDALMYIESPDGDNLWDVQSMDEAERILSHLRKNPKDRFADLP